MSRYDWSKIPAEYEWAATNGCGFGYAYVREPKKDKGGRAWLGLTYIRLGRVSDGNDWHSSLERRTPANLDPGNDESVHGEVSENDTSMTSPTG